MRKLILTLVSGVFAVQAYASDPALRLVTVAVQNVTAANVLSPFVVVVLKPGAALFSAGLTASKGIANVAETGSTEALEEELAQNPSVLKVVKAAGVTLAGRRTYVSFVADSLWAQQGATLNLVSMIGKSNDSFVAIQHLPIAALKRGGVRLSATNYDAGSEENTGNVADFGPGGHPTAGAEGLISVDRGLNLRGDAPEAVAWGSPAALVTAELR